MNFKEKAKEVLKVRRNQVILGISALAILGIGTGVVVSMNAKENIKISQSENQKKYDEIVKKEKEEEKKTTEEKKEDKKDDKKEEVKEEKREEKKTEDKKEEKQSVSVNNNQNKVQETKRQETPKEQPKAQPKEEVKQQPKQEEKPKEQPKEEQPKPIKKEVKVETEYNTKLGNTGMFFNTFDEAEAYVDSVMGQWLKNGYNRYKIIKVLYNGVHGYTVDFRK